MKIIKWIKHLFRERKTGGFVPSEIPYYTVPEGTTLVEIEATFGTGPMRVIRKHPNRKTSIPRENITKACKKEFD